MSIAFILGTVYNYLIINHGGNANGKSKCIRHGDK